MIKKVFKIISILFLLIFVSIFIFNWMGSNVTDNIDSYIYNLPYQQGTSHKVVQGYGGLFSHKNIAAVDFNMPVGTPIYAAREGIIYSIKEDSNESGPFESYKNKANYIIIKHQNGSYGCYWHLQYKGIVTKKGFVEKGQLIGYSGNTGLVLNPHLHFSVKLKLNYDMDSFTKTKFNTSAGVLLLERGSTYERPL